MYNQFSNFNIEIFGESHAKCVGVKISGLKKGISIDLDALQSYVDTRKSGKNVWSTPRVEQDKIIIKSGITSGKTDGNIFEAIIENNNVKDGDYENFSTIPRPSHADYVCAYKDKTNHCPVGGGRFSGRLTAPLVIAGGIVKQILASKSIEVLSYIRQIGKVIGKNFSNSEVNLDTIKNINTNLKSLSNASEMENEVLLAKQNGDSVGGIVDVVVYNMPIGIGDNLFNGLEGRISSAVYAVPAVKGVAFGLGFDFATKLGSQANDPFIIKEQKICTSTNNSGGINGGISNGMPITLSVAFRPTPSISISQKSVDLSNNQQVELSIKGRHDACIVPRGAVAVESAVALAIYDALLDENAI